ncbi:hypothetical protein ACEPPN_001622 [Leptodophora sp. 'Broadleaf-Isolate-01']
MMCGPTQIDGYAFCLGLKSFDLSYTASLQTLPSVLYLIERAGLRSKHTSNSLERFSLNIRCLAELIDMFHTRQATDVRDKVYALLGMSSDDPGAVGLRPNYEVSWKGLFQQLIKFILGKDISVKTSHSSQGAVIKSKGCILGQVSSVISDDRQNVNITSKNTARYSCDKMEWTLQASAKLIQEGDIVCLLHGASKPTIIRLYKDYFAIIVIAITPLKESGSGKQLELSKSTTHFPRDFLLVWDWEQPLGESQDLGDYETFVQTNDLASGHPKTMLESYFDKATRTWDVAMILDDFEEYERAEERIREAIEGYEVVFGEEHPHLLRSQYGRTPLTWAAGNGYDTVADRLLKHSIDPDLKDSQSGRAPLSWAAGGGHGAVVQLLLATGKVDVNAKDKSGRTPLSWAVEGGHEAVVHLLLAADKIDIDSKDKDNLTLLLWAAYKGHEAVIQLLLGTGKVNIDAKDNLHCRTPLSWASYKGHEAVVQRLLTTGKADVNSEDKDGRTPLLLAVREGHEAMVRQLLAIGKVDVNAKDKGGKTSLSWAAVEGRETIVQQLLATGKVEVDSKDENSRTPLSWAVEQGHEAVVKLLLATGKVEVDSKDKNSRTPLSWAVEQGHEAVVKLLLATGKVEVDSKDKNSRTPLSWAAKQGHEAIVKLLLATGKVEVDSKDKNNRTPLSWAAEQGQEAIVKLLLETNQVEVDSTDKYKSTPLRWAAENGHEAVLRLFHKYIN